MARIFSKNILSFPHFHSRYFSPLILGSWRILKIFEEVEVGILKIGWDKPKIGGVNFLEEGWLKLNVMRSLWYLTSKILFCGTPIKMIYCMFVTSADSIRPLVQRCALLDMDSFYLTLKMLHNKHFKMLHYNATQKYL